MKHMIFIDARTRKYLRMTAFTDSVEECLEKFRVWALEHDLKAKDIWYANIFECGTDKHLATVVLNEDGSIVSTPAPDRSRLSPYCLSIKQMLSYVFH